MVAWCAPERGGAAGDAAVRVIQLQVGVLLRRNHRVRRGLGSRRRRGGLLGFLCRLLRAASEQRSCDRRARGKALQIHRPSSREFGTRFFAQALAAMVAQ